MTKLGKIMIFVNLAISVFLMSWAMYLFFVRIDWSDNPVKADHPEEGQLVGRRQKVLKTWQPVVLAEPQWHAERDNLETFQGIRRDTRRWYELELAKLDKAPNPKQPVGVQEIVLSKDKMPEIIVGENPDPTLKLAVRIKMAGAKDPILQPPGVPDKLLYPANVYDLKDNELLVGVEGQKQGLYEAKRKLRGGVEDVVGEQARMLGPKGLPQRIKEDAAKREGIVAEQDVVHTPRVNTLADSGFALEREKELKARLDELETHRQELMKKLDQAGGGKE